MELQLNVSKHIVDNWVKTASYHKSRLLVAEFEVYALLFKKKKIFRSTEVQKNTVDLYLGTSLSLTCFFPQVESHRHLNLSPQTVALW